MNLVRNVTVTKEASVDYLRRYTHGEIVRVDLDLNPRATYSVATHYSDCMLQDSRNGAAIKQRMTEENGRRIAYSVAVQVREEIEHSVMRLLGFLKPGERGSLSRI